MIAPLTQYLSNNKYEEFIQDIINHSYVIGYGSDIEDEYYNGYIMVCLDLLPISYKISFMYNERASWRTQSFDIHKVENLGSDSFNGNLYDYLDLENKFYKENKDLAAKKENEKQEKIKQLRNQLELIQEELKALEN